MSTARAAWFVLARLGLALLAGLLTGWLLDNIALGLVLALCAMLAWQLLQLHRLDRWLRDRGRLDPPDAPGVWGEVVARVVRLHRRKRHHKQRMLEVFRDLRRATATMPDGVLILNSQGDILWFNRTAGQQLGLRRGTDRGLRLANLVREPALARYLDESHNGEPLVIVCGDPGVHLSIQAVPHGGEQRLILVRDISRQVALEAVRRDFVANASHELRSPLTVFTGYLETLLQEEDLDPALRGPLAEMQRQSQRMNSLVSDLLELSRLDAIAGEVEGGRVDVPAVTTQLCRDVQARPVHPEVELVLETQAGLRGEEKELHSAFFNLVDNAVKYTPATGRVRICWRMDGQGQARFEVHDTGPGIAAEHLPRLTERFYRVDPGRARSAGGTGLGLAIVKHVLQHHGAQLEVRSEPGKGSVFTCVFPARRVLAGGDANSHSANLEDRNGCRRPDASHIAALQ